MRKYDKVYEWLNSIVQYQSSDKGLHRPNKVRSLKGALNSACDHLKVAEPHFFNSKIASLSIHNAFNSQDSFSPDDVAQLIEMMKLMVTKLPRISDNNALRGSIDLDNVVASLLKRQHLCLIDFEYNQYRVGDAKSFVSSIVDFGLVVLKSDTLEEVETVSQLLLPFPEMKMATYCKKMTGITDDMLEGKPSFKEFLPVFESLLENHPDMIFLHWGGIECSALNKEFLRCGIAMPGTVVFYDLQPLVSRKFGERQISLKNAANFLGVDLAIDTHRAVNDAIYLAAVTKAIVNQMTILAE